MPRQDRKPTQKRVGRKPGNPNTRAGNGVCAHLLPEKVPSKLSFLESKFIIELMQDPQFNAERAAVKAGYNPNNAHVTAMQLLKRPKVWEALQIQLNARAVRTGITVDLILKELAHLALADIRDMFNKDGSLKPIPEMTKEQASLISSLEQDELYQGKDEEGNPKWVGKVKRAKLYDRQRALETIAKHLGMLTERYRVETKNETTTKVTHETVVKLDLSQLKTEQLEQIYAIASTIPVQGREKEGNLTTDTGSAARH